MAYETVLYEKSGHVATITLNRPEMLNAFNDQMRVDSMAALRQAEEDAEVRCVILTAAGRAFSAGADVGGWNKEVEAAETAKEPPSPLIIPNTVKENYQSYIMGMTTPVICAINGVAVGMGATIPLSCDIRLMSETARIGFIFVKRGVTPELGSTLTLPRIVGWGKAKELCLTGRFVEAKEAKEIGLVAEIYAPDKLMEGAMKMANEIAANPPIAIKFTKRGLNLALDGSLQDIVQYEQWAFATCQKSEDFKESIRAFLEKREPKYRGR